LKASSSTSQTLKITVPYVEIQMRVNVCLIWKLSCIITDETVASPCSILVWFAAHNSKLASPVE